MNVREKRSVVLTVLLGILLLCAVCVLVYWLPTVVNGMIDVKDNWGNRNEMGVLGRVLVITDAYAMVALGVAAVVLMFLLLRVVWRGNVFSKTTTHLLSAISWCCFGVAFLSLLLIVCFQLALCLSLAAGFLGLSLRVVRHVLLEATRIKSENDFTV